MPASSPTWSTGSAPTTWRWAPTSKAWAGNWSVNDYSQVRQVVEALQDMKLPGSVIEKVACANYARVLKAALSGGR